VSDVSGEQLYDIIGTSYPVTRRTEPRIAAQVRDALGDARTEGRAVRRLPDDLVAGRWAERSAELVDLDTAELGLRLLIA
jgi:hypothetical protein